MYCNFTNKQLRSDLDFKQGDKIIPQMSSLNTQDQLQDQDGEINEDVDHRIQAGQCKLKKTLFVRGKYLIYG